MTDIYNLLPSFKKLLPKFLDKKNTVAVIDTVDDVNTRGHEAIESLKGKGYQVIPIEDNSNNLEEEVGRADVALIATAPSITLEVMNKICKSGIKMVWIELGSETKEAIDFCGDKDVELIYYHSITKELTNPIAESQKDAGKEIS